MNIRIGNNWQGEKTPNTDGTFEQFTEMKWGLRAAFIILRRYIQKYNLNTIEKIVSRWAPSTENNTKAYIRKVCQETGFESTMPLDASSCCEMVALVDAMCFVENGQEVPLEDIVCGWLLATGKRK
jgi:hypothetical protein